MFKTLTLIATVIGFASASQAQDREIDMDLVPAGCYAKVEPNGKEWGIVCPGVNDRDNDRVANDIKRKNFRTLPGHASDSGTKYKAHTPVSFSRCENAIISANKTQTAFYMKMQQQRFNNLGDRQISNQAAHEVQQLVRTFFIRSASDARKRFNVEPNERGLNGCIAIMENSMSEMLRIDALVTSEIAKGNYDLQDTGLVKYNSKYNR